MVGASELASAACIRSTHKRPLLCSGPVVSLHRERRGFFVASVPAASHTMTSPPWKLDASRVIAQFEAGEVRGELNLRQPARGLSSLRMEQEAWHGMQLLGVDIPSDVATLPLDPLDPCPYVRHEDLVAAYAPSPKLPVRVEVYWRDLRRECNAISIGMQVSVQTDHLDTLAELSVVSRVPSRSAQALLFPNGVENPVRVDLDKSSSKTQLDVPACVLYRLAAGKWTYLEMVHPADSGHSWLVADEAEPEVWNTRHQIFRQGLEKGVILRARVRGVLVPSEREFDEASRQFRRFANEDLPLTV